MIWWVSVLKSILRCYIYSSRLGKKKSKWLWSIAGCSSTWRGWYDRIVWLHSGVVKCKISNAEDRHEDKTDESNVYDSMGMFWRIEFTKSRSNHFEDVPLMKWFSLFFDIHHCTTYVFVTYVCWWITKCTYDIFQFLMYFLIFNIH